MFLIIVGAFLLVYVWGECRARQGAADQKRQDQGWVTDSIAKATDAVREQMAQQDGVRLAQLRRQAETIRALRERQPVVRVVTDSSPRDSLLFAVRQRDVLIENQQTIIATQDSSLSLYAAMVASRDSLIPRLVSERDAFKVQRDAYRRQAGRKLRWGPCAGAVVGLGGTAGLGFGICAVWG